MRRAARIERADQPGLDGSRVAVFGNAVADPGRHQPLTTRPRDRGHPSHRVDMRPLVLAEPPGQPVRDKAGRVLLTPFDLDHAEYIGHGFDQLRIFAAAHPEVRMLRGAPARGRPREDHHSPGPAAGAGYHALRQRQQVRISARQAPVPTPARNHPERKKRHRSTSITAAPSSSPSQRRGSRLWRRSPTSYAVKR